MGGEQGDFGSKDHSHSERDETVNESTGPRFHRRSGGHREGGQGGSVGDHPRRACAHTLPSPWEPSPRTSGC